MEEGLTGQPLVGLYLLSGIFFQKCSLNFLFSVEESVVMVGI